jgi:hypothetical protein
MKEARSWACGRVGLATDAWSKTMAGSQSLACLSGGSQVRCAKPKPLCKKKVLKKQAVANTKVEESLELCLLLDLELHLLPLGNHFGPFLLGGLLLGLRLLLAWPRLAPWPGPGGPAPPALASGWQATSNCGTRLRRRLLRHHQRASGFSPSFGGPCFGVILLGGGLGSQKNPSGALKPAPRAELTACSDRTKSKEQRGRPALVVNNYVPDATPTTLLLQLLLN